MLPVTLRLSPNRVVRGAYLLLGILSLALGFIGLFLPLMPTTVFILIAVYFFARSSQRLHSFIMDHKIFGPLVRDYQAGLGVPMYAKVLAALGITFSFTLSGALFVKSVGGRLSLIIIGGLIIWYVWSRPTRRAGVGTSVPS